MKKVPSLFEFLSYMNNFSTGVVNTFYDYKDFENWIYLKGVYANMPNPLFQMAK